MNLPTILISLVILVAFLAIVVRGLYNRKHHKGGCSCGCSGCANSAVCHPKK